MWRKPFRAVQALPAAHPMGCPRRELILQLRVKPRKWHVHNGISAMTLGMFQIPH